MSFVHIWRRSRLTRVISTGAVAAILVTVLPPTVAYADELASSTSILAVTSPANGKLAADTDKQVVQLTVSGANAPTLSESSVTGVKLGGDSACANIQSYVVTSATTLTVKTPSGGCPVSSAAEPVAILFVGSHTMTKASAITFVTPPAIRALDSGNNIFPVVTDNSTSLTGALKVRRFVTNGGQTVRVYALAGSSGFAFDPRTGSTTNAGLAVSMSGKAGTNLKVYDPDGVQIAATAPAGALTVGNSLTFTTATAMSAGDDSITITQNGVSKTFSATDTGIDVVAAPIITSLSVTSGKTGAATTTVITGKNFDADAADWGTDVGDFRVTFCGILGTDYSSPSTTSITVKTPTAVANADPGLGSGNYSGSCKVQVGTDPTTASTMSPVTTSSIFTFLNE